MVHPLDPDWEWREGGEKRKKQAKKDANREAKQKKTRDAAAIRDAAKNPYTQTDEEGNVIVPDGTENCCDTTTRRGSFSHGNSGCGCFG